LNHALSQLSVHPVERDEWLCLAARFGDNNYRQGWEYGRSLAKKRKAESHHIKITGAHEVLGIADIRIKRAPLLGGIAYISGGPLTRTGREGDIDRLAACLRALRQHYVENENLILRVQAAMGDPAWNHASRDCFAAEGFAPATHGTTYRTIVVDLQRPLPEIRSRLAQKWRNCLNKAERSNAAPALTTRLEDFDKFTSLFDQFVRRKGFNVDLGADFYRAIQSQATPPESLTLATIESNGTLVAGHMSSMLGDTCVYLLGATSDEALKSNAAYLLQWNAIKLAHERGLKWYDLGGIDPEANPGVYHFKNGMGGQEMIAPGPFELSSKALRSRLILRAESTYRWLRHRKDAKASPAAERPAPRPVNDGVLST